MDISFWSGGKDSYLSYHFYTTSHPHRSIALLTTFNENTNSVPHQEISIQHIKTHAEQLGIPLYLVPLPPKRSNEVYLSTIDRTLNSISQPIDRLIFGDWHAPEISNWRKENFNKLGYQCEFPLTDKSIETLLTTLHQQPVQAKISAVQNKFQSHIEVGTWYDTFFVENLPDNIHPLGETGEFHTRIIFN